MLRFCAFGFFALFVGMELLMADALEVILCDSVGKLESVELTDCEMVPCTFHRRKNYTMIINITPKGDSEYLKFNATANLLGVSIPLLSGNVCDILGDGQKCPIKDGVTYKIQMETKVPPFVPMVWRLTVNATVTDEFDNVQVCASLPARIL